jgi:ATP-dependent Clp protease ATP-binding subunit ClpA
MTTNAGARDVSDRRLGFADAGVGGSTRGALERTFTPEFRNRLDAIVTFNALGTAEVEKAHPDMVSILLQVMDHATLTDSHGRKADFRHVILIMTTNAGARDLSDRRLGFGETGGSGVSSRGALEKAFTPEFRNRLDAIVHFNALGPAEIERVVDKQIDELRAMVAAKGVAIELDPLARARLAAEGFDRAFGARPMARLIERKVKKPLSEAMLFGALANGGTAHVVIQDDDIRLVVNADEPPRNAASRPPTNVVP